MGGNLCVQDKNSGLIKPLMEREVYQQVADLLGHNEDLLAEFAEFLKA